MVIKNNRLLGVETSETPHRGGGSLERKFLVMHYSAGGHYEESLTWWKNKLSRASAHVLIGRGGEVVQVVPFNVRAWHAGGSKWTHKGEEYTYLNRFSLSVELANWGPVTKVGDIFVSWAGREVSPTNVTQARHKNEVTTRYWEAYTPEQIESATQVCASLMDKYKLEAVLGHDDISPTRKVDPGPAFPFASFAAKVSGRDSDVASWVDLNGYIDIDEHYHEGALVETKVARLIHNPQSGKKKLYTK